MIGSIYSTERELDNLVKQYNQAQGMSEDIGKVTDYHMKKVKSKDNFDKLLKQVSKRSKR